MNVDNKSDFFITGYLFFSGFNYWNLLLNLPISTYYVANFWILVWVNSFVLSVMLSISSVFRFIIGMEIKDFSWIIWVSLFYSVLRLFKLLKLSSFPFFSWYKQTFFLHDYIFISGWELLFIFTLVVLNYFIKPSWQSSKLISSYKSPLG